MVPAKDRSLKMITRLLWIGLGLAMVASDFGCAAIKEQIYGTPRPPAELGRVGDNGGFYSETHRMSRESTMSPPMTASVPGSSDRDTPQVANVEEVGVTIRPAEVSRDHSVNEAALQPAPTTQSATGMRSAASTVPNASRILAGAERPSQTSKAAIQPSPTQIVAEARSALSALANYQVAMHRQERVHGTLLPEEDVVLSVRREPRAIRLNWPSGPNQGREVLYRADEPGGQMHVKMANAALPRLSISPESPMVLRNSRHPITEAGFDSLIESLEASIKSAGSSEVQAIGQELVEGFQQPLECLIRTSNTGELWRVYFDPQTHLPTVVQATNPQGELLERYVFRDLKTNLAELNLVEAFDTNARWGSPRGLFGLR